MLPIKKSFFSLILVIILGNFALAQGLGDLLRLALPGSKTGARALGMGGSYIAMSDDASGLMYNPAGIGLMKRMEFQGGLRYTNYSNSTDFMGVKTDYSSSSTKVDNAGFVLPIPVVQGSLVFGFSYNSAKDFNASTKFSGFNSSSTSMIQNLNSAGGIPFNLYLTDANKNNPVTLIKGNLNQSGTMAHSGEMKDWVFSGALEAYKSFFVGLSLHFISGSYDYSRNYFEDDFKSVYSGIELSPGDAFTKDFRTFNYQQNLNWEISGLDIRLGTIYQIKNFARIGATIQFPKAFTIKEKFDVNAKSFWGNGRIDELDITTRESLSDKVEYDITTPFGLTAGGAINLYGAILTGEVTVTDYTQSRFSNPVGISASYINSINQDIKDFLRATVNYNFGAEYTVPTIGLRIRSGYYIQKSPYKDDPADFDKKYITYGLGFLIDETMSVDAAWAHGTWKDVGDNYVYNGSNVSRTYQSITEDQLVLSFSYRF